MFLRTAKFMQFSDSSIKEGKYSIPSGLNSVELIRRLRSGNQEGINVTLNNYRTTKEMSEDVALHFRFDSNDLLNYIHNADLESLGITEEQLLTLFIPNTYEFFWTASPQNFVERMIKEHDAFWNKAERTEKLKQNNLTKAEAYTLASIVQKETNKNDEKARVAGVYLNRLKRGMLLQADPTVIFAVGDFSIRRVLYRHLEHDSKYNTYKYLGLPPGPICMPDVSSIDAVLNAEGHSYLYFCAKADHSGYHSFAKTLREHNRNAKAYQKSLK